MNNAMNKKGIISLVMIMLLVVGLFCACGDNSDNTVSGSQISGGDVSGTSVSAADTDTDWYGALNDEQRAVADALLYNIDCLNARDIEGYMKNIAPDGEAYETTREDAEYVFAHYRLNVTVDSMEVGEIKDGSVTVKVTQSTTPVEAASDSDAQGVSYSDALSGKDLTAKFAPCVTELTHTMLYRDGVWYISSTVIDSYREINTQWELLSAVVSADSSSFVSAVAAQQTASASDVSASDAAVEG